MIILINKWGGVIRRLFRIFASNFQSIAKGNEIQFNYHKI